VGGGWIGGYGSSTFEGVLGLAFAEEVVIRGGWRDGGTGGGWVGEELGRVMVEMWEQHGVGKGIGETMDQGDDSEG